MTPDPLDEVSRVYHAALERAAGERRAFLEEACAGNEALKREVASLLGYEDAAGEFIEAPALLAAAEGFGQSAVLTGRHIGSYTVQALIGAGGMGEVYRARDSKLGRDVAIKILPRLFTTDPQRRARFDREARLLASLNHPHIGAVYGVEEADGAPALVMELVEGEDLTQRIARAPIPLADALPMARQIAEALETAHGQGIIHRDLKPANIKVRADGTVKVLDFGLAKVLAPTSSEASNSPTMLDHATEAGFILGTAAYMSPEQARGKAVDKRTDIWAFGVVLYEMLTARPLYTGETASEILARVIEREPDVSALPTATPPAIRVLIGRCLTKDLRDRLQAIGEARIAIEHALAQPDTHHSDPALGGSRDAGSDAANARVRHYARVAWGVTALALVGIAALAIPAIRYLRAGHVDAVEERWQVVTPPTSTPNSFAISPDGQRLVFSATVDGKAQLWIRPLADVTPAQPLAGTDGAASPFWRPDGHAIGFFADSKLKWIDAAGGAAHTLASANLGQGGSWNQDGDILFVPHVSEQVYRVSVTKPETVVAASQLHPPSQTGHSLPWFLPDGRHFLYRAAGNAEGQGIYVGELDSSASRRLIQDADGAAVYAPPGFLLFARQGTLMAQRFDLETLTLTGETFKVAEAPSYQGGAFSCSAVPGAFVYRSGSGTARQLAWVDRAGKLIATLGDPDTGSVLGLALSPDGLRVALSRAIDDNHYADIFLLETTRVGVTRLTDDPASELSPVWSPDGQRVAFNSNRGGVFQIWETAASGTGADKLILPSSQAVLVPTDWSLDGRFLLYFRIDSQTGRDVWVLPWSEAGGGQPLSVARSADDERLGQFSPDGKWIAYQSNRLGHFEIYAQPFPGPGGAMPVSTRGGTQPHWRSDGKELFYIAADDWLTAVSFRAEGQSLQVGTPVPLFPSRIAYYGPGRGHLYAVAKGGQKFLIEQTIDQGVATLTVVRNWRGANK